MPDSFGGGFAGDRAGLMNLENVLGNVTNQAMQSRMFNSQQQQQAFEQMMAGKQFGLQQKQFGLAQKIEPWATIGNLLGWGTQGQQRVPLAQDFYKMMMGGKPDMSVPDMQGGGGVDINATVNGGATPPTTSFADRNPLSRLGLDAVGAGLGGWGGAYLGHPIIGAGVGAGAMDFMLNRLGTQPSESNPNPMGLPTATPTPNAAMLNALMGQNGAPLSASGVPSISPSNVNKRNSRKSGASAPGNSMPTPQSLPGM